MSEAQSSERAPGEEHKEEEEIVGPSVWPFGTAGGMALVLFGLTTSLSFCALGVLIVIASLVGWVGDMRRG